MTAGHRNATLKVYEGAPHGVTDTHKEQLGRELLEFAGGGAVAHHNGHVSTTA